MHMLRQAGVVDFASQGRFPPPKKSRHATTTTTTTTSQREAGAVMVTASSDLQRLLMLPRAASYPAWHGLCESSATFKFT